MHKLVVAFYSSMYFLLAINEFSKSELYDVNKGAVYTMISVLVVLMHINDR